MALVLVLLLSTTVSGCAAALGEVALGGELVELGAVRVAAAGALEADALAMAGRLAVQTAPLEVGGALSTASRIGAASDVAALRGLATRFVRTPGALTEGTQLLGRGGSVLGSVESLSANELLVRSGGGTTIRAIRTGSTLEYRAGGRSLGFSQLRDGRLHHYVHESLGTRYVGYDVAATDGRIFQYDAGGQLIREVYARDLAAQGSPEALALLAAARGRDRRSLKADIRSEAQALVAEMTAFRASRQRR